MRNTGKLKSGKTLKSSGTLGGGGLSGPLKSLSAKKRLKARSDKKKLWFNEQRAPFVADFLERNPYCVFRLWVMPTNIEESPQLGTLSRNARRCGKPADDVHEIIPQGRGGNAIPVDGSEENFLPLCRWHHTFITSRPAFARDKGYTR